MLKEENDVRPLEVDGPRAKAIKRFLLPPWTCINVPEKMEKVERFDRKKLDGTA
jgi:hypothetical protein